MHTVRPATFSDIPSICILMELAHIESKYAEYRLDLNRKFKPLLMESIRSGNGCVYVSLAGDNITGFIVGMIDDLYHVLHVKYASDMFFYALPSDPRGFVALLDEFLGWAQQVPDVVRIRLGATNAVGDFHPVAKLYVKKGLTLEGEMYEMEVSP